MAYNNPNYYQPFTSLGWQGLQNPASGNSQRNQQNSQGQQFRDTPNYFSAYEDAPDTPFPETPGPTPPPTPPPSTPPPSYTPPGTDSGRTGPTPGTPTNPPAPDGHIRGNWSGVDFQTLFMDLVRGLPPTPQSLISIEKQLAKLGMEVMRNAAGVAGKIKLADGRIVDVLEGAGAGGISWQWLIGDGSAGAGAGAYTPMIMPDGMVPPGMPYQPTPDQLRMQDDLIQQFLTNPMYSDAFRNRLNEQQKELALTRGQGLTRSLRQDAASRGTYRGGANIARNRRLSTDLGNQLLQSQRDVALRTEGENRQGFLNALNASEGIFDSRFNRSMQLQRFLEAIREYGMDDAYRWAMANLDAENAYIGALL